MSTDESIEEMRLRIRELSTRVEIQETQVASLRSQLRPGVAKPSQAEPTSLKAEGESCRIAQDGGHRRRGRDRGGLRLDGPRQAQHSRLMATLSPLERKPRLSMAPR